MQTVGTMHVMIKTLHTLDALCARQSLKEKGGCSLMFAVFGEEFSVANLQAIREPGLERMKDFS